MSQTNALFISHHPIDFEFVYQLATDLKNAGLPVWLDQLDSNQTDETERTEVLLNASGMLVVLSPDYAEAEFARHDLQYAYTHDLPVIAVVVRSLSSKQTYAHIPAQFLLDFTHWRDERDYRTRLDRLYATIKARVPVPPALSDDAETRYLRGVIARLTGRIGALEFMRVYRSEQAPETERPISKVLPLWGILNPLTYTDAATGISSGAASLAEALEKNTHILVTGAAGSGKTTVVERLALDLAVARMNAPAETEILPALPLILPLPDWSEQHSAEDFIRASWSLASDPVELAAEGQLVLIFDGLHKVGAQADSIVAKLSAYLSADYSPVYFLLTCRTDHALRHDLGLSRVEVGPFNPDRIRQFVEAHLGADTEAFLDLVEAEPRTQMLARTPAHLQALILIYKSNPGTQLPTSVGGLYKQYFPALWLVRRYGSVPLSIKFGEVQSALGKLALHLFDLNMSSALPKADALKALGGESYLREARDAGLLDTRGERVRFTSTLYQEYFAASALQPVDLVTRLKNAEFSDEGQRLAGQWDQVAVMMAGMSSTPDAVVREVSEIDPFLAGLCLASGVEVARSIQDEIGASLMVSAQGKNQNERISAARALSAIGRRASIANLLQAMRTGSWRSRRAAAEALQSSGAPLPVRMIEGLSDWNWDTQSAQAERVLRELGTDAIPVLMSVLNDEDWIRRRGATWALGKIGDMAAVPGLVDMLRDPDVLVRREAILALGSTKDNTVIQYLLPLLRDVDRRVRYAAAEVLVSLKDESIPGLIDALSDEFDEVRATAVSALGTLRAERALEPLMQMSSDTSPLVRCEVAKALGMIRDPRAIATLTEQLNDNSRVPWSEMSVCNFAVEALQQIGTKEAMAAVEMWKRRADTLGAPATPDTEPERPTLTPHERRQRFVKLTEVLGSSEPSKRSKALIAMSTLGDPEAERYMLHHLRSDPDSQVRQVAATALTHMQTDQARIALRTSLRDPEVVDFAKDTLIQYGAFAVPSLLEALYDTEPIARSAAIEALIEIGQQDPEAVSDPGIFAAFEAMIHDSERAFGETKTIGEMAQDALLILRGTPEEETILLDVASEEPAEVGARTDITAAVVVSAGEPAWERNNPDTIDYDNETPEESTLPLEPVDEVAGIMDTADTPVVYTEDIIEVDPSIEETTTELESLIPLDDDYGDLVYSRNDDDIPLQRFPPAPPDAWPDLPALIVALQSGDYLIARKAAGTIRSIAYAQADIAHKTRKPSVLDTPEVVNVLQETLKSDVPLAKWAAIEALAYIRNRSTTVSLLDLMRDTNWTLRLGVVRALAEIADADALPAVIEALHDDHGLIRQAACQTLGRIGSSMAIPELVKALRDEETFVRWTAATALGDLGHTDAVPNLIEATRDTSRDVRWSAAAALGKIGDPTAIDALVALLHDNARPAGETEPIHYVAAKALYQIGVPEAMQHVRWWRKHYQR